MMLTMMLTRCHHHDAITMMASTMMAIDGWPSPLFDCGPTTAVIGPLAQAPDPPYTLPLPLHPPVPSSPPARGACPRPLRAGPRRRAGRAPGTSGTTGGGLPGRRRRSCPRRRTTPRRTCPAAPHEVCLIRFVAGEFSAGKSEPGNR